jgi:hypothetical protein
MGRNTEKKPTKRAPDFALPAVLFGASGKSRSCIAFAVGRKYLHVVKMDEPISVDSLPIEAQLDPALLKGKPYPVKRAARLYLRSQIGKTERAKRILRALAKGDTEVLA